MDTLDRHILDELSYQCRVSFSKLAEKYEVSLNTIKNRVETLVEEGVIQNFVVQLHLGALNASFAVILLDVKPDLTRDDLIKLGEHPFIMALGLGYELQGFAVAVYRTNTELSQAVDFLQSSDLVDGVQALPMVSPPIHTEIPSSKGIDTLKKIDWKILKSLSWDGRKALGDIASEVGASVPTIRKRLSFMRKNGLIHETIQINPAASERRLVVMIRIESPVIIQRNYYEVDMLFHNQFAKEYWISYRAANTPELMVTFVVESSKRVAALRSELLNLVEDTKIIDQIIVPEWIFFSDFRYDMILDKLEFYS